MIPSWPIDRIYLFWPKNAVFNLTTFLLWFLKTFNSFIVLMSNNLTLLSLPAENNILPSLFHIMSLTESKWLKYFQKVRLVRGSCRHNVPFLAPLATREKWGCHSTQLTLWPWLLYVHSGLIANVSMILTVPSSLAVHYLLKLCEKLNPFIGSSWILGS